MEVWIVLLLPYVSFEFPVLRKLLVKENLFSSKNSFSSPPPKVVKYVDVPQDREITNVVEMPKLEFVEQIVEVPVEKVVEKIVEVPRVEKVRRN
jgi:hypothetical protein